MYVYARNSSPKANPSGEEKLEIRNSDFRAKRGFTLVELVISIAILTLMLFGISELFSRGLAAARSAEHLTVAAYLGQAQLETLLATEYPDLPAGTYEARAPVFEEFERETIIEYAHPDTLEVIADDQGLKRVRVVVYYPLPGRTASRQFATIVIR